MSKSGFEVECRCLVSLIAVTLVACAMGCRPSTSPGSERIRLLCLCAASDVAGIDRILRTDPSVINGKDDYGDTALHFAAAQCSEDVVRLLIRRGAVIEARGVNGETPLRFAIRYRRLRNARTLIGAGANLNAFDDTHWAPLHGAVIDRDLAAVKLLVEAGADVNACNDQDKQCTPLSCAQYNKFMEEDRKSTAYKDICAYLMQHGAKMKCKSIHSTKKYRH